MEPAKRMVEEGYGITVFPEAAVKREMAAGLLKRIPLDTLNLVNSYYLLSLKGKVLSMAAEAFQKMLSRTSLLTHCEELRADLRSKR